ncbi:MAG: hypothetical protein FJY77_01705 [Candidatus Altiarchaeales archaeon]|nr:hypothetical protein [Candidatus Altiarchaeales archaeon]
MKHKLWVTLAVVLMLAVTVKAGFFDVLGQTLVEAMSAKIAYLIFYPLMVASIAGLKSLMSYNPTVFCFPNQPGCEVNTAVNAIYPYIINILIPVYIVAMMFTAMFFIMKSGSPAGRVRAKKMLFRLIIGMLFVIYSPMMYQALLDISGRITGFYLSQIDINKVMNVTTYGKGVAMCYLQCCMTITFLVTAVILLIRWFYVYVYSIFFPLIMFMYFFEVTKSYGSKYLKEAITWIFVPPLQALTLYVLVTGPLSVMSGITITDMPTGLHTLFTQMITVFVILAGMVTMCAAPMIMTQILQFVGMAVYSVGLAVDNLPLMSLGGVIAGQGPGAFATAHGHFSRIRTFESARAAMMGSAISKVAPGAMRLLGERGAMEGRGGAFGGGGGSAAQAPSGREYDTGSETLAAAAAQRRGMPTAPDLSDEIESARYSKTSEEKPEDFDTKFEEGSQVYGERSVSEEDLEGAREEGELMEADLSPKGLKMEREAVKGEKGLLDLLGGRERAAVAGGPSMGPGFVASPKAMRMAGGRGGETEAGVKPAAEAGAAPSAAAPEKIVHVDTTKVKKPHIVIEGDTIVRGDEIAGRRKQAEMTKEAQDKEARKRRQTGEIFKEQRDIAALEEQLKFARLEREKREESQREEKAKKKEGKEK